MRLAVTLVLLLCVGGCAVLGGGPATCEKCQMPAGVHHVCGRTAYCTTCDVDVADLSSHTHRLDYYCERCGKEVVTGHQEAIHPE